MRCTQYIGLTNAAKKFVAEMQDISKEHPENKTFGMFEEDVPLSVWKDKDGTIYFENLQCSPWSSGPMLFTRLVSNTGRVMFEWFEDINSREYNPETGGYYV